MVPESGFIFGVLGTVIGVVAGLYATWVSVRNARSREERAAYLKVAAALWGGLFLLLVPTTLALTGLIDRWVFLACALVYLIAMWPFVLWADRCVANACRIAEKSQ